MAFNYNSTFVTKFNVILFNNNSTLEYLVKKNSFPYFTLYSSVEKK